MDKPTRVLPHVRQRDNLQEHQARMAVPAARDHSACRGTLASPSHLADRFIPCRVTEEDQSAFDDFRSPKRFRQTDASAPARTFGVSGRLTGQCAGITTGAETTESCLQQPPSQHFGLEDATSRLAEPQHLQVSVSNVSLTSCMSNQHQLASCFCCMHTF